jgi:hypothetical protein
MKLPVLSVAARASTSSDYVSADTASLATHMSRCAAARGRFFNIKASLQELRDLLFGRIVTVAVVVSLVAGVIVFL